MRKFIKPAFDLLLFSNLFMALCAVAQGMLTFHLIGSKTEYTVLWLLFTSTLGIYNFSMLVARPKNPERSPHQRVRWFYAHFRLMVTITIVSILSLIPLFFLVSLASRLLLIFLALLSFSYGLPLFRLGERKFGLRNIPGLKLLLISMVWTLSIVLLPILEAQHPALNSGDTALLVAGRFLFIAAVAIPFDIRDLFEDRAFGLKTIPVALGEKNAYRFCQFLLLGCLVLLLLFRQRGFDGDFFALTLSILVTGWLILRARWEKNEYYYFFFLDGVLILQYLFVLALGQIAKAA